MKIKMLAAATLIAVTGLASAQSVSLGFAAKELDAGGQTHISSFSVKQKLLANVSGDIVTTAEQNDSTKALTNRYELGLTYSQKLVSTVTGDFRVAHGYKIKSGSDTTTYYSLEPSVTAKIQDTPLSVRVGYRWRNAWESNVADNTETTRLAVIYDLTAKDKLSLGRDSVRGDAAGNVTSLVYTRAF